MLLTDLVTANKNFFRTGSDSKFNVLLHIYTVTKSPSRSIFCAPKAKVGDVGLVKIKLFG